VWPQGSAVAARPRRGRHDDAGTARVRQSNRRRSVVLKNRALAHSPGNEFPGAKYGLKMACGEKPQASLSNPRPFNAHGKRGRLPRRMDSGRRLPAQVGRLECHGTRARRPRAILDLRRWLKFARQHFGSQPCYRADEIGADAGHRQRVWLPGARLSSCGEAYKIAETLKGQRHRRGGVGRLGGFKMESNDSVKANLAITDAFGARAMIHSDSADGAQRLNQEVAKAMYAGRAAGIMVTEDQAIRWLTINPAWALDLDGKIGSIEVGKNADVVLWSAIRSASTPKLRGFGLMAQCCSIAPTLRSIGARTSNSGGAGEKNNERKSF